MNIFCDVILTDNNKQNNFRFEEADGINKEKEFLYIKEKTNCIIEHNLSSPEQTEYNESSLVANFNPTGKGEENLNDAVISEQAFFMGFLSGMQQREIFYDNKLILEKERTLHENYSENSQFFQYLNSSQFTGFPIRNFPKGINENHSNGLIVPDFGISLEAINEETQSEDSTIIEPFQGGEEKSFFLSKKTKRTEASESTSSTKAPNSDTDKAMNKSHSRSETAQKILQASKNDNSQRNLGRWSNSEHEVFIEALIKYGKKWEKVKKHIKTRSYFQIVHYTERFFKRIRKVLKIRCTLSFDTLLNFKKLIPQKQMKTQNDQYPKYDLDLMNYKEENDKKINYQNLFFEMISKINHSNVKRIGAIYRPLITSEIKAFFIKEFLVLNKILIVNSNISIKSPKREKRKDNEKTGKFSKGSNCESKQLNKICKNISKINGEFLNTDSNCAFDKSFCHNCNKNNNVNSFNLFKEMHFNFLDKFNLDTLKEQNNFLNNNYDNSHKTENDLDTEVKCDMNQEKTFNCNKQLKQKHKTLNDNLNLSSNCKTKFPSYICKIQKPNINQTHVTKVTNTPNQTNCSENQRVFLERSTKEIKFFEISGQDINMNKILNNDVIELKEEEKGTNSEDLLIKNQFQTQEELNAEDTLLYYFDNNGIRHINLYENLKSYFIPNSENQLKAFYLKVNLQKEFESMITQKLNRLIKENIKSPTTTFFFNKETKKFEISKKQSCLYSNKDKVPKASQCPQLTSEEMKIVNLIFSDVRKYQKNLITLLDEEKTVKSISIKESKTFDPKYDKAKAKEKEYDPFSLDFIIDKCPKEEDSECLFEEKIHPEKNFLGDLFLDTISSFSDPFYDDFI